MFERFSEEARLTVKGAQEQARQLGSGAVGSEHLLLSLLIESDGTARRTLEMLVIRPEAVRAAALAAAITYPPPRRAKAGGGASPAALPFTEDAKKVFGHSLAEAIRLGHRYIGAEHILLALIRDTEGVAGRVLAGLGADPDAARNFVGGIVEDDGPPAGLPAEWGKPKPSRRTDGDRRWRRQRQD